MVAEGDSLAAWQSVLEHTSDRELRRTALEVLTDGTLRCARWRAVVGHPAGDPALPRAGAELRSQTSAATARSTSASVL